MGYGQTLSAGRASGFATDVSGSLTINGNLTMNAGSTNTFEVNGSTLAQDVVTLGAAVTYNGVLNVVPSGTFTNGVLSVVSGGAPSPAYFTNSVVGGTNLVLSWPAGQGWHLEWQTNLLNTGLSTNWMQATDTSVNSTNFPIDKTKPTVFYRLKN